MALATQCPHCYTSFRVANDQLKLHAGMVRCGACKQTFNGIEHLLEPGELPRTPPARNVVEENIAESSTTQLDAVDSVTANQNVPTSAAESKPNPTEIAEENESPTHQQEDWSKYVSATAFETSTEEENKQEINFVNDAEVQVTAEEAKNPGPFESEHLGDDAVAANEDVDEEEFEHTPSQQELDDIALFQEKLASFTAQIEFPSETKVSLETDIDELTTKNASSQLEIIEEDTSVSRNKADSEREGQVEDQVLDQAYTAELPRNAASLTSSLDFELNDEERSWTEPNQVSQLEIQTQAAIVDGDESKYSRHEPVFSDDTVLEDELEQDLHQLLAETKKPEPQTLQAAIVEAPEATPRQEPTISIKDPESPAENPIEDDGEEPDFMLKAEKAKRYSKVKFASLCLGVVLLFVTASAQGFYFFRSGIAAHFPQTKPLILQMCQKLSCQIKLPTQIDNIVFDSTELLTINQDPHILSLSMQLQNKSAMTQAWPMLELTLKDSRGKTVLQRVFTPEEYLENRTMVTKGFAANSDSNIKVHFELTTMKAANYAVGVFYP